MIAGFNSKSALIACVDPTGTVSATLLQSAALLPVVLIDGMTVIKKSFVKSSVAR